MGTVHTRTVAVHFRYDCYMRRLVNEFLDRNPISAILHQSSSDGFGWTGGNMHVTLHTAVSRLATIAIKRSRF